MAITLRCLYLYFQLKTVPFHNYQIMASFIKFEIATTLTVMLLLMPPRVSSRISCPEAYRVLAPCRQYLRRGGRVPPPCCSGVREVVSGACSPSDYRSLCSCLTKPLASGFTKFDLGLANLLPQICGVSLGFKIGPSTDCSRLHAIQY